MLAAAVQTGHDDADAVGAACNGLDQTHQVLGESVEGKDVFIADDIIASGESMLDIAYELKLRGARNIFTCCTFPLFTAGLEKFDKAYNDGIIKAVLGTNLTYRKPELLEREWYYDVDVSKYTAYFIARRPWGCRACPAGCGSWSSGQ